MFYGECYKCGERWELGTASTCKCEVGMTFDASAPVKITSHPYFYKRPWVGLTDEEKEKLVEAFYGTDIQRLEAVEAKLKEKNT